MRRFLHAALLAFIVGVTTRARADRIEYRDVAVASGLRFPGSSRSLDTPSHVETQHITLTCRDERNAPVCDFTASYRIANRETGTEQVAGAFYGRHLRNLQIAANGSSATATLPPPDVVRIEEQVYELLCGNLVSLVFTAAPAAECTARLAQPMARWTHGEFTVSLSPGETQSVVVTGTLEPGLSHTNDESWMPSRHPLLGKLSVTTYDVDFWLDAIRADTEFEVRLPDGWNVSVRAPIRAGEGKRTIEAEAWPLLHEGDRYVARRRFAAGELPEAVNVVIERSPTFLRRGGPFIGVGGALGTAAGFRMRMGYELALGTDRLAGATLASLSVDTDWNELVIVAPGLELAVPVFLPSLGLGLGLPVVLAPERRVGARGMLGVHLWGVGFVASYDWLPGTSNASRTHSQWTLLGQLSF